MFGITTTPISLNLAAAATQSFADPKRSSMVISSGPGGTSGAAAEADIVAGCAEAETVAGCAKTDIVAGCAQAAIVAGCAEAGGVAIMSLPHVCL